MYHLLQFFLSEGPGTRVVLNFQPDHFGALIGRDTHESAHGKVLGENGSLTLRTQVLGDHQARDILLHGV